MQKDAISQPTIAGIFDQVGYTAKTLPRVLSLDEFRGNAGGEKFQCIEVACTKTFINRSEEILNSFEYPFSNGYTEGVNNKIKVIKRNAFGVRNFKRFRNRILHVMS
jgi:hypothetical protein